MKWYHKTTRIAIALILLMTGFSSTAAYAAFPVKAKAVAAPAEKEIATHIIRHEKINKTIEKLQKRIPARKQEQSGDITNVLSFIFGMMGIASLITGILISSIAVVTILPIGFGIAAIILGTIGIRHRHKYKGFGIAGLVSGIIDVSIGFILLGLFILLSQISGGLLSGVF